MTVIERASEGVRLLFLEGKILHPYVRLICEL